MAASDVIMELRPGERWAETSRPPAPTLKSPQLMGRGTWEVWDADVDAGPPGHSHRRLFPLTLEHLPLILWWPHFQSRRGPWPDHFLHKVNQKWVLLLRGAHNVEWEQKRVTDDIAKEYLPSCGWTAPVSEVLLPVLCLYLSCNAPLLHHSCPTPRPHSARLGPVS